MCFVVWLWLSDYKREVYKKRVAPRGCRPKFFCNSSLNFDLQPVIFVYKYNLGLHADHRCP